MATFVKYMPDREPIGIYGAKWDGSSTTKWVRTDDAKDFADPNPAVANGTGSSPFDNIMPWRGMVKRTDPQAGVVVDIPKFYYKWTRSGKEMWLQICEKEFEGSHVSPAHADRGDGKGERDVVSVGRYHCAAGDYKSKASVYPVVGITRATARDRIKSLGNNIWQSDFRMYWTIRMLYLVEYADWDSQQVIGYGCNNSNAVDRIMVGNTDGMKYHTGTSLSIRGAYGPSCQYRNIEGLWDNCYDFVDGININSRGVNIIDAPSKFADGTPNYAIKVAEKLATNGVISGYSNPIQEGYEWAMTPDSVASFDDSYTSDIYYTTSDGTAVMVGGDYYRANQGFGLFTIYNNIPANFKPTASSARLMILPDPTT